MTHTHKYARLVSDFLRREASQSCANGATAHRVGAHYFDVPLAAHEVRSMCKCALAHSGDGIFRNPAFIGGAGNMPTLA